MTARMTCSIRTNGQAALAIERLQGRDHAVGLGRPQARHHFVEQKKPRSGGQRPRDFETLAVRQGQGRGELLALVEKIEPPQQSQRVVARGADIAPMQQARRP